MGAGLLVCNMNGYSQKHDYYPNLFNLIAQMKSRARPIGKERDVIALTCDSSWRTYDATSETSPNAKWILLSYRWEGGTTVSLDFRLRMNGRATALGDTQITFMVPGSGNKDIGQQVWVEMNDSQEFQYYCTAQGTLAVYIIGYLELGE